MFCLKLFYNRCEISYMRMLHCGFMTLAWVTAILNWARKLDVGGGGVPGEGH